ncbi:hypothetical protein ES288_D11G311300v1 [Gossypium darwinii]|uniref:Uncharacterized protein n=1 Tax=Gossypium darwinii TaxID=34276 RepID=A0A5D2AU81_GOSDA|nr:hypothetical protein ES288_D11G311300v1 [Gossypium darwinii]
MRLYTQFLFIYLKFPKSSCGKCKCGIGRRWTKANAGNSFRWMLDEGRYWGLLRLQQFGLNCRV